MRFTASFVLCLFVVAVASASEFEDLLAKISNPALRSVEVRQASTGCTFYSECKAAGQTCDFDPFNFAPCTECTTAITECLTDAAANNKTSCDCQVEGLDCLRATGNSICYSSFLPTVLDACETECEATNETDRCGVAPAPPTVSVCTNNAFCSPAGTCTNAAAIGGACNGSLTSGTVCASGVLGEAYLTCNATDRCAITPHTLGLNDGCADDDECASSNCTAGFCVGAGLYESCVGTACDFGLFCATNGTCLPADVEGAPCTTPYSCGSGLFCSEDDICVPLFSRAVGENCTHFTQCTPGATCNTVTSKCGPAYTPTACYNDTDCAEGTTCSCDPFDSTTLKCQATGGPAPQIVLTAGCVERYNALLTCAAANDCGNIFGQYSTSCAETHCPSERDCVLSCLVDGIKAVPGAGPATCQNYPTFPCEGSSTGGSETGEDSAASIFAPVAALLVALFALFA